MKRGTRVWCAVVVLMVGLILSTSLVQAVSQCGDQTDTCYCGKANPMPCCDNNCNGNKLMFVMAIAFGGRGNRHAVNGVLDYRTV